MNIQALGLQDAANEALRSVKVQSSETNEGDFAQKLMDVIKEVDQAQSDARDKQNAFMTGQPVEYHELMIALERASTAMQLTIAVRNKVLEVYQEISRLQI